MTGKRGADSRQEFILHHAVAELDRGRETFGIGPTVALDHDAVQSKKDPAIGAAGIHPLAQLPKGGLREKVAYACTERPAYRAFEIFSDLTRGALGCFQRDIPGETFRDHHIDLAAPDIVALDETLVIEIVEFLLAQDPTGLPHLFQPFR